jgi:hypothetical protein
MDLATITGQREGDLLKLPNRDPTVYTEDGIVFWPGKSKRRHPCHGKMIESSKTVIVEWSPELEAVLKRLRKLGPDMRRTLFSNLHASRSPSTTCERSRGATRRTCKRLTSDWRMMTCAPRKPSIAASRGARDRAGKGGREPKIFHSGPDISHSMFFLPNFLI